MRLCFFHVLTGQDEDPLERRLEEHSSDSESETSSARLDKFRRMSGDRKENDGTSVSGDEASSSSVEHLPVAPLVTAGAAGLTGPYHHHHHPALLPYLYPGAMPLPGMLSPATAFQPPHGFFGSPFAFTHPFFSSYPAAAMLSSAHTPTTMTTCDTGPMLGSTRLTSTPAATAAHLKQHRFSPYSLPVTNTAMSMASAMLAGVGVGGGPSPMISPVYDSPPPTVASSMNASTTPPQRTSHNNPLLSSTSKTSSSSSSSELKNIEKMVNGLERQQEQLTADSFTKLSDK